MPVQVKVRTSIFRQQFPEHHRRFVKPLQIRIQPAAPGVAVGFLFEDGRFLGECCGFVFGRVGMVGDGSGVGKIRAGIKWRVDVDPD